MSLNKSWRHYKALNRKNWILYIRRPACSITELIIPIAVMLLLTWFRTKVPLQHTDSQALQKYKHPAFPALQYTGEEWEWNPEYITNEQLEFMTYNDYAPSWPPPFPIPFEMQFSFD